MVSLAIIKKLKCRLSGEIGEDEICIKEEKKSYNLNCKSSNRFIKKNERKDGIKIAYYCNSLI
jgi:hypothetical protein